MLVTSGTDMRPIMGKMMMGRKAVSPMGTHSVIQNTAMTRIT